MTPDQDHSPSVDLPALALSQPQRAEARASEVLARTKPAPSAAETARARQALMIVARDAGRVPEAVAHGRAAMGPARRAGHTVLADVMATYGVTLVFSGRTARGLAMLEQAAMLSDPADEARVLHRRAGVLALLGRHEEALADVGRAVERSALLGDRLWQARSLAGRSDVELALGRVAEAALDAAEAERLLLLLGELSDAAVARHNQALAAYAGGDIVRALADFDDVARRQAALGEHSTELTVDRSRALVTAGLLGEARAVIDAELVRADLAPVRRAELLLAKARICLSQNETEVAQQVADDAARLFGAQRRPLWARRAALLGVQARAGAVASTPAALAGMARALARLVPQLAAGDPEQLPAGLLLQARVASARGRRTEAESALTQAAAARTSGPALARATGWLAAALLAQHRRDSRGLLRACRRGMAAVEEYRTVIGDLELRSLATRHGLELATLAAADRVAAGDARGLLEWGERWRATALTGAARPPADPELDRDIAALRDVSRRLGLAEAAEEPALGRERDRLEQAVRRRYRHLHAVDSLERAVAVQTLQAAVTDEASLGAGAAVVSLVAVGADLHAVVVDGRRARLRRVGPVHEAFREGQFAQFSLRRAAFGRRVDLASVGERLQQALLGEVAGLLDYERVVVVPPADLLTAPFATMPALRGTVLTVTPSAAGWVRGRTPAAGRRARDAPGPGQVALVGGPGLRTGVSEVRALAAIHSSPRVRVGDEATVDATIEALDGVRLGHVVAHGTFRDDAPLFSSLRLADGPLSVHDFDRMARAPREIVLSACDVGSSDPIGAHEALGLVSALLAAGSSSVLASVVPVSDVATIPVMTAVHTALAGGASLPEALRAARRDARDGADSLVAATALSFTAWGA